jgi:putative endonuclease
MRATRQTARKAGAGAEDVAADWLAGRGYGILARGFSVRGGELDIIAALGYTLAFVEVKARPRLDIALGAIDDRKRRRIAIAVRAWIARNPWAGEGWNLRGDAVLIGNGAPPMHLEDAFPIEFAE